MQEYPCLVVALTVSRPAAATLRMVEQAAAADSRAGAFSTIRENGPERQRFR